MKNTFFIKITSSLLLVLFFLFALSIVFFDKEVVNAETDARGDDESSVEEVHKTVLMSTTINTDLNNNGIPDNEEDVVVVDRDVLIEAGEYKFQNLIIRNNARVTLESDPSSPNDFKGVKITARNLTISSDSSIDADGRGYPLRQGPGAAEAQRYSLYGYGGASYGGTGGSYCDWNGCRPVGTTYGSALIPLELGSNGGGGAIQLIITDTFINDGLITTNGGNKGTGGSVYITSKNITGNGVIRANGGQAGGGGRIAVYYESTSYAGEAESRGGCDYRNTCGGDGTVGFIDSINNDFYVDSSWAFEAVDRDYSFNNIYIFDKALVRVAVDARVTAQTLNISATSSFYFLGKGIMTVPTLLIEDGSNLTLPAGEYVFDTLSLTNGSTLIANGDPSSSNDFKGVQITALNLTISSDSSIDADGKGYPSGQGPGVGARTPRTGSYGGNGLAYSWYNGKVVSGPTYGSALMPLDLGSDQGGGAIRLIVTDTFRNDGVVTANGLSYGSGGSVYVTTNTLVGSGMFRADGGNSGGGGGRIAVYHESTSYAGEAQAKGGCDYKNRCGGDGTVLVKYFSEAPATTYVLSSSNTTRKSETVDIEVINGSAQGIVVSGDMMGLFNINSLKLSKILSGDFVHNGFFSGSYSTTLESIDYSGLLYGAVSKNQSTGAIQIYGYFTGGIEGIFEGVLEDHLETVGLFSDIGLNVHLSVVGGMETSARIDLRGQFETNSTQTSPQTVIEIIQVATEGNILGRTEGYVGITATHVGVADGTSPLNGEGFSFITYVIPTSDGQGWSYDRQTTSQSIAMRGLLMGQLYSGLLGTIQTNTLPETMTLDLLNMDYGQELSTDIKVNVWGPQNVSPGQTIDYIVEVRNDGLLEASDIVVSFELPWQLKHISSTGEGEYVDYAGQVLWDTSIAPGGVKRYTVRSEVIWALPQNMEIETFVGVRDNVMLEQYDQMLRRKDIELLEDKTDRVHAHFTITTDDYHLPYEIEIQKELVSAIRPTEVIAREAIDGINEVVLQTMVTGGVMTVSIKYPHSIVGEDAGTSLLLADAVMRISEYHNEIKEFERNNEMINSLCITGYNGIAPSQKMCDDLRYNNEAGLVLKTVFKEVASRLPGSGMLMSSLNYNLPISAFLSGYSCKRIAIENLDLYDALCDDKQYTSRVITAHDPNIKYGPTGYVKQGEVLDYEVEYENEGEGIAFGVYVTDRLDENLDESTLYIGPMKSVADGTIVAPPGVYNSTTRIITWFVGEVGSREGGIADVKVRSRADAPDGTVILNYATVYFPSVPEVTKTNVIVTTLGEPEDTVPPTTTHTLAGKTIVSNTYLNEINITLTAEDNEEGTGVKKTEYSLDNGDTWHEYTEPVEVTDEGTHIIYYRSTDWFGNVEETKSVSFVIVSARGLLSGALNRLQNLESDNSIKQTIKQLEQSLDDKYWQDKNTLSKLGGKSVFAHLKNVIKVIGGDEDLKEIVDDVSLALEILLEYNQEEVSVDSGSNSAGGSGYIASYIREDSVRARNIGNNSATINWLSSQSCVGKIVYSSEDESHEFNKNNTLNYGYTSVFSGDKKKATGHEMTLANLESGTTYFYRVISSCFPDIISREHSFTTKGKKDDVKVLGVEYTYGGDVDSLYGLEKYLVEMISEQEAEKVFGVNEETEMYEHYREIYDKIIEDSELSYEEKMSIAYFIAEGTKTTMRLGAGERAGVLNSYRFAFGGLPTSLSDWQDAIKIANGRWPGIMSASAETKAKQEFKKMYLREPSMDDPNDNAAITIMTYGLRPVTRNMASEKSAQKSFVSVYGHPIEGADWDIIRSIAYSGAER